MRKLKETRLLRGFSQDEVFWGTKIDRAQYSRIERGGIEPSANDREILCAFFKMTEDELFPEYKDGPPERDRELYRKLRKKISLVEKIELLGNNPDHETYHGKLIALGKAHGIEVE